MKFNLIRSGLTIAALLALPVATQAADLSTPSYKAPAYVAPSYSTWSGFYIGLNAGYGFGNSNWDDPALRFKPSGFLVGGTLGYNFQTGVWVWGVEGDFDWANIQQNTPSLCAPGSCKIENNWLATARARIGYGGWGSFLPYITGGAALGGLKATNTNFGSKSATQFGYTIGAGLEYALLTNFSVKLEYLYADLGKFNCGFACDGTGTDNVTFTTSLIRGGVNYRF